MTVCRSMHESIGADGMSGFVPQERHRKRDTALRRHTPKKQATISDMDAEIAALERRREKTWAIKQGIMQQPLTGRVRLV